MSNEKRNHKPINVVLRETFTNKTVLSSLAITLFLLIAFRIGSALTIPGIKLPAGNSVDGNSFTGMLDLLAGGGLGRMSIFAVGVGPYITSQIIVQLLSSDLIPPLSKMAKAGERGRRKLEIITRFITLPFCIAQGYAVIALLLNNGAQITIFGHESLTDLSAVEIIYLLATMVAGTYIAIFLGDIITKRGVGNGITLLILAGIVSSIIPNFSEAYKTIEGKLDAGSTNYLINLILSTGLYTLFFIIILVATVFINNSTRKIPIQQTGQGLTSDINNLPFLPIKLNAAGVIPVIFASSIMTIPGTIAQFLPNGPAKWFIAGDGGTNLGYLTLNTWSGLLLYFIFIILFSFFYSYVQINPQQLSENFEKSGKFIPGVKSGRNTEKHIAKVLSRVNWIGGPFLAVIAILPYIISQVTGIPSGLALGGTGLIIIVTATMELWNSIKSASTTSGYNVTRTRIEAQHIEDVKTETKVEQLW
ncbi:MAG: preprotein translocase subunit SecY [Mycoplasmataceae bacterium]|nr:preprotein translocase subunit SecY [Mycoplasmataceae bacterium]